MSPAAPVAGAVRDPQVVILELESGPLVFVELFVTSGYGYEVKCEIVGAKGTIELAPTARVVVRSDFESQPRLSS
jgi:myo-inositol 2-dehydrogenase / D-chiro-inositol 1-dehydrogenase